LAPKDYIEAIRRFWYVVRGFLEFIGIQRWGFFLGCFSVVKMASPRQTMQSMHRLPTAQL
jgi:hypothetical protein